MFFVKFVLLPVGYLAMSCAIFHHFSVKFLLNLLPLFMPLGVFSFVAVIGFIALLVDKGSSENINQAFPIQAMTKLF